MIQIKFSYKGNVIPIQCSKNNKLKEIFNKLEIKIENNSVYYLYIYLFFHKLQLSNNIFLKIKLFNKCQLDFFIIKKK